MQTGITRILIIISVINRAHPIYSLRKNIAFCSQQAFANK